MAVLDFGQTSAAQCSICGSSDEGQGLVRCGMCRASYCVGTCFNLQCPDCFASYSDGVGSYADEAAEQDRVELYSAPRPGDTEPVLTWTGSLEDFLARNIEIFSAEELKFCRRMPVGASLIFAGTAVPAFRLKRVA